MSTVEFKFAIGDRVRVVYSDIRGTVTSLELSGAGVRVQFDAVLEGRPIGSQAYRESALELVEAVQVGVPNNMGPSEKKRYRFTGHLDNEYPRTEHSDKKVSVVAGDREEADRVALPLLLSGTVESIRARGFRMEFTKVEEL